MDASLVATGATVRTESTLDDARPACRSLAGLTAAAVAVVPGVAFHLAGLPFVWLGVPVAALLGAWLGPNVRAGARLPVGTIARMGILAVVFGAEATGATLALLDGPPEQVGLGLAFGLLGLVMFGLPALVVTIPCALAWAWLTRALLDRSR